MLKNLKKQNEGFTIIEVMIVLVIAAIIILIVFLAIPALQRNSRNTQRKNDVAALLAGVSAFSNNNNGKLPTAWDTTNSEWDGATGTNSEKVNLGFYDPTADVTLDTDGVAANPNDPSKVIVVLKGKCDTTAATINNAIAGSSQQIVAVYTGEGSANAKLCQEG